MYIYKTNQIQLYPDLITIEEIEYAIEYEKMRTSTPEFISKLNEVSKKITENEVKLLYTSNVCPISFLKDRLQMIDPEKYHNFIIKNYYNSDAMSAVLCNIKSFLYADKSNISINQRIRRWFPDIELIGNPSVQGYAFKSNWDTSKDTFIIKAPRNSNNTNLLHELIIGLNMNRMRKYSPNGVYCFGGFGCSPPILNNNNVIGWCNTEKNPVEYIIYENISPSVNMKTYCKNCTFEQWLDKYLQILFFLSASNKVMNFTHYDLHYENVLIRNTNNGKHFYIPYDVNDKFLYLKTEAVAVIIDYGFSYIKVQNLDSGVANPLYISYGVYPDQDFPMHDAFKLLGFSMLAMLNSGNLKCFSRCIDIMKFFNISEMTNNPKEFIRKGVQYLYSLPYSRKTVNITHDDFLDFIKNNIVEYHKIVSDIKPNDNLIGCVAGNVCLNIKDSLLQLGINEPIKVKTVFDFYDVVSRLQNENRLEDAKDVIASFNAKEAISNVLPQLELNVDMLDELYNGLTQIPIMSPFDDDYINYLDLILKIIDTIQQIEIVIKSINFIKENINIEYDTSNITNFIENCKKDLFIRINQLKSDILLLYNNNLPIPEVLSIILNINTF